ncbi:alpha/beta hydrolase family protein [Streptomyces sp. NPDC018584]|uniref:alpha/beta hydrolase family protein n=1 Tax=unclassified Streptomyces TaxID=2593676 RepID=UPI0037AC7438
MRRTLLPLALCGALLSPHVAAEAAPRPPSGRLFSYGPHERQNITVYGSPSPRRPALVIVHGGSWARDTDWSGRARWFADRGFTVYDTDYRLTSDAAWPAQRDDVLAALRWVGERERGERPLVLGSSAGGHLALQAGAYGEGRSRVRGVVALSPVASPYRAWADGGVTGASAERRALRKAAERLAGCAPDLGGLRCWERWDDLAVKTHASGTDDAPLLLIHSAGDFVPRGHSVELAATQRRAGQRDVTVRTARGAAHGGQLLKAPGLARVTLRWLRGHA